MSANQPATRALGSQAHTRPHETTASASPPLHLITPRDRPLWALGQAMPRLVQQTSKLATLSAVQPVVYRIESSSGASARWHLVKAYT